MSVNSILTNSAAANALLNFNKTQSELQDVQSRLSTGQKVGSAKDNASTFAIALGLRSDVATFKTVKENLATGSQIVDSSLSVATSISDQISTLKTKLAQAKDQPQGRALIQQDIDGALDQIKNWTKSATFNGINLLDGKGADAGQKFSVTASLDRNSSGDPTLNSLNFDYQDLSIEKAGKGLGSLLGMNVVQGAATETKTAAAGGLLSATFEDKAKLSSSDADITGVDLSTVSMVSFTVGAAGPDQKTITLKDLNVPNVGTDDEKGTALVSALNAKMKETYPGEGDISFFYDAATTSIVAKDLQNRTLGSLDAFEADGTTASTGVAAGTTAQNETRSAFTAGDEFKISYKDASGAEKSISMKAVTGEPTNAFEFKLGTNASTGQKDTIANLKTQLDKLTATGGVLEGSGLTFSATNTELKVERDPVNSKVQLTGLSTKSAITGNAVAATAVESTQSTATNAQVKLSFGDTNVLKAGDNITLTLDNNGKAETLSFRIGSADQTVKNGAKVDGADNTYWLNYRDAVGSEGETRTGAQVAELINFALTKGDNAKLSVGSSAIGAEVDGLSFRLYGGIAADSTENRSTASFAVDKATLVANTVTAAAFTVGGVAYTLAVDTTGNSAKDLEGLSKTLNAQIKEKYGTEDIAFVADNNTGEISLRDYQGRALTAVSFTGGTGFTNPTAGTTKDATTATPTNAAARFDHIATARGASLTWDGQGSLTLTDTAQDNKTKLTSFNVNGNSNGLDFSAMMKQADEAEQTVKKVLGSLGSASSRLTAQSSFVDNMVKTLNNNVSTLVDADMAEEAARLQALQTKSQLGIQALSTANQSTQSILSLFR